MTEKKIWISLEGLIGAGKSTWLTNVLPHLPSGMVKMDEPVSQWQASGMLEKSYTDPEKWGFPAQLHFLSTRLDEHKRALKDNPAASLFISERSPFTDKMFWKTNLVCKT